MFKKTSPVREKAHLLLRPTHGRHYQPEISCKFLKKAAFLVCRELEFPDVGGRLRSITLVNVPQHVGLTLMNTNKTRIAVCLGLVLTFLIFGFLALRGTASSTQELAPAEQALLDAGIPELPNVEVFRSATGSADQEICKSVMTERSVSETRDFYETTLEKKGWKYQQLDLERSNSYCNQFLKGDQVFLLSATPAQTNHRHTFIQISYRRTSNSERTPTDGNGGIRCMQPDRRTREVGFQ